jgi:hypothetical protein
MYYSLFMLERWRWAAYVERAGTKGVPRNLCNTVGGKRRVGEPKGMRTSLIWDGTPRRLVVTYRHFETICPSYFQGSSCPR